MAQPKAGKPATPSAPIGDGAEAPGSLAERGLESGSEGESAGEHVDGMQIDNGSATDADAFEAEINTSLDEVLDLLAQEVERLQVALEFYRLGEHSDKERLIRWHVQQIDDRQDRLEDIKDLILARGGRSVH